MNRLQCLIIDDEPVSRKILREYIEDVDYLELKAEAVNAIQGTELLAVHQIDLIFLDVQMPGMNGIQFLSNTPERPITIITTAYPDYALQGYELDVLDYLVKPIAFDRFVKAVHKAEEYHSLRAKKETAATDALYIKCDRRIERIAFSEISYVEAMGNFIAIHAAGRKYVTWFTFKGIEEKLPAEQFVRIHKSYIVSLAGISRIEANKVILPQTVLPVSKHYRKEAMDRISPYLVKRR